MGRRIWDHVVPYLVLKKVLQPTRKSHIVNLTGSFLSGWVPGGLRREGSNRKIWAFRVS
jgi:hypothetical protein